MSNDIAQIQKQEHFCAIWAEGTAYYAKRMVPAKAFRRTQEGPGGISFTF